MTARAQELNQTNQRNETDQNNASYINLSYMAEAPAGQEGRGMEDREKAREERRVVLVGSGDYARAAVACLVRGGHRPIVASRNPAKARTQWSEEEVEVSSVEEGIAKGNVVVLAIPARHHNTLPAQGLANKVVVDISNRAQGDKAEGPSLAEQLQNTFPDSHVVKAFNTVGAIVLERPDLYGSREVPICGRSDWAKSQVAKLVTDMGHTPRDVGGLQQARALEAQPFSFFPEWKMPVIVSTIIFIFFWLLTALRRHICPAMEGEEGWQWAEFHTLPLHTTHLSLAATACSLILICYIPGLVAAYLQLWRGTKYSRFPDWLDRWLKARKQLGLMGLLLGSTHGCMAILAKMTGGINMVWYDQLYLAAGVLLHTLLVILGLASLPSVSAKLTWREFSAMQRYLGWSCVVLVTLHSFFANYTALLDPPTCRVVVRAAQLLVPLCFLTLLFKVPLLLPCIDSHLTKIRGGYERVKHRKARTAA